MTEERDQRDRIADILKALDARRVGRMWVAKCPAHDDHAPSLSIYLSKDGDRLIFQCGVCDWADVRAALRERGLLPRRSRGEREVRSKPPSPAVPPAADFSKLALALWSESVCAVGTVVERYLIGRGLERALSTDLLTHVLRFHPRCPRGRGREVQRVPAMVALMRRVEDDVPVAVHRTFLGVDGTRDGKRMMLGPSTACAIKLCEVLEFSPVLHVAEGIETGLAAMMLGYCPLWAMGSAGAIETLPIRDDIGELVVCGDNDGAGYKAACVATARWQQAGHEVRMKWPDRAGEDFADQVRHG